ncbi:MAG: hypothetical protein LBR16_05185 [Treponema sp.]|jgi:hypothetical protein|nr:hypothetical protein [Treponema sp.]
MLEDGDNEDDGRITFYYSREHRLARATPTVRAMNEASTPRQRRGFLKSLSPIRPRAVMLLSILLAFAVILLGRRLAARNGGFDFAGNTVTLDLQAVDGTAVLALEKTTSPGDGAYTGDVGVVISKGSAPEDNYARLITFTADQREKFRISLPAAFGTSGSYEVILACGQASVRRKMAW